MSEIFNEAAKAKPKRVGISKKVRFEVFKRDGFRCVYCGEAAPKVVLHVDHINPVSKGGDSDGKAIKESVIEAWKKIGGILHIGEKTPEQQRLHYVIGILRKRLSYFPYTAMQEMEAGLDAGIAVEDMVEEAKRTRNWSSFSYWLANEES